MKLFAKKPIPHAFVLEELERLNVHTKAMFGCTAIYHGEKILLILRERTSATEDNGIWLATYEEHHESLKKVLPSMRAIQMFGPGQMGWRVIPSELPSFEEEAFKLCELVLKRDPRVGRVPKTKLPKKSKAAPSKKTRVTSSKSARKFLRSNSSKVARKVKRVTSPKAVRKAKRGTSSKVVTKAKRGTSSKVVTKAKRGTSSKVVTKAKRGTSSKVVTKAKRGTSSKVVTKAKRSTSSKAARKAT